MPTSRRPSRHCRSCVRNLDADTAASGLGPVREFLYRGPSPSPCLHASGSSRKQLDELRVGWWEGKRAQLLRACPSHLLAEQRRRGAVQEAAEEPELHGAICVGVECP